MFDVILINNKPDEWDENKLKMGLHLFLLQNFIIECLQ